MGAGTPDLPLWSNGLGTFHLHDFEEPSDARAVFRTERLTPLERQSLWRRRAIVHAVMRRWDEARRFSARRGWRVISGWPGSSAEAEKEAPPLIRYDWAYSRRLGMKSAQLDLLTFAEEALVPVESLRKDAVAPDDSVFCQERSRWRVLQDALSEVDPDWQRPAPAVCPAFDAFVDPRSFSHFEILLADPSTAHPESVFGHLLLRPVRHPNSRRAEEVIEVAAVSDARHGPLRFLYEGVRGGYLAAFGRSPFTAVRKRYLQEDQRGLRRFRLLLTPEEATKLWDRIWELERRGYVAYHFFNQNCASLLLFLMAPALDAPLEVPTPWAMPTAMLDLLAQHRRLMTLEDGSQRELPLAVRVPQAFESNRDTALAAEQRLTEHATQLDRTAPTIAPQWHAALVRLRSPHLAVRRAAQGGLESLVARTLDGSEGADREDRKALLRDILASLLQIERHAADHLQQSARAVDMARLIRAEAPLRPAAVVVSERQARFRREDPRRGFVELRETVAQERLWEAAPRRAPTAKETKTLAAAEEGLDAYVALAATVGRLSAQFELGRSTPGPVADTTAWIDEQTVPAQRGSGHLRFALGAGLGGTHERGLRPSVMLRAAVLAEHLGEDRDRGFGNGVELRVLDGLATFDATPGASPLSRLDLALVRFRALTPQLSVGQQSVLPAPGRGFGVSLRHRRDAVVTHSLRSHAELYVPFGNPGRRDHALIGVGAFGEVRSRHAQLELVVGPRLEWTQRIAFGPHDSRGLRFDLVWLGGLRPGARTRAPASLEHQLELRGAVDVPVRLWGRELLVSPGVSIEGGPPDRTFASPSLQVQAGLLLERL